MINFYNAKERVLDCMAFAKENNMNLYHDYEKILAHRKIKAKGVSASISNIEDNYYYFVRINKERVMVHVKLIDKNVVECNIDLY
jgi:hypothetical protein